MVFFKLIDMAFLRRILPYSRRSFHDDCAGVWTLAIGASVKIGAISIMNVNLAQIAVRRRRKQLKTRYITHSSGVFFLPWFIPGALVSFARPLRFRFENSERGGVVPNPVGKRVWWWTRLKRNQRVQMRLLAMAKCVTNNHGK